MNPLRSLWISLRSLLLRRRTESELDEELRLHLEMEIEHNVAQGMTPDAAERAARVAFGGLDQVKEASRDAWGWRLLPDFGRDAVCALKSLRRSPGFTLVAILTLGLGIGVNAVMFAMVRDSVLRPFLRDESLNLTAIHNSRAGADRDFRHSSYAEFETLLGSTEVFADVAARTFSPEAVGVGDNLQRRFVAFASANYLSLIGARPLQGRFFTAEEAAPGASRPVAVANHGFWERLGSPGNFVGSTIRVNQRDYTVIGITPRGFVGLHATIGPDVWLPLGEIHFYKGKNLRDAGWYPLSLYARLPGGLSPEAAQARLPVLDQRLNDRALPEDDAPRALVLAPPSRLDIGNPRPGDEGFLNLFAALSLGMSITVLVVACLNLANMVLARGAARGKEIAIRLSLGASRGRIVRQLTTEGFVLSLLGGGCGLVLSLWADSGIYKFSTDVFASSNFVLSLPPFIDLPLLLATFGFCLVATLTSSLGPALRITRLTLVDDLKQAHGATAGTSRWRRFFNLGNNLVIAQIALSLTLLFSASLFIRSSLDTRAMDLGFHTADQLVANLDYRMTDLDADAVARRQQALIEHMTPLVGEGRAALASGIPYNFELSFRPVFATRDGGPITLDRDTDGRAYAGFTAVSENYFSLLGIHLLRGRTFTREEATRADSPGVTIIDQTLARTLFGDAEALGRRVYLGEGAASSGDRSRALEIVGIVRSPRDNVFGETEPRRIYRPLAQAPTANVYLHLGTTEPIRRVETVRRALREFDSVTPILFVRPLATFVEKNINGLLIKLAALVFGIFGGIALLLAVVGVYGVKAHAVTRRTREIGIRMALGARPAEVMGLILRQSALQTAIGLLLGAAVSVAAGTVLANMIYRAQASNATALIGSCLILASAVLLACYLPARRATRVDPAITLRSE